MSCVPLPNSDTVCVDVCDACSFPESRRRSLVGWQPTCCAPVVRRGSSTPASAGRRQLGCRALFRSQRVRPRQATERGRQRQHPRSPFRAGGWYRGDHLRFVARLVCSLDRSGPGTATRGQDHWRRDDSRCFAVTGRTGDRGRRRTKRSHHLEHPVLITPIFVNGHLAVPPAATTRSVLTQIEPSLTVCLGRSARRMVRDHPCARIPWRDESFSPKWVSAGSPDPVRTQSVALAAAHTTRLIAHARDPRRRRTASRRAASAAVQ